MKIKLDVANTEIRDGTKNMRQFQTINSSLVRSLDGPMVRCKTSAGPSQQKRVIKQLVENMKHNKNLSKMVEN